MSQREEEQQQRRLLEDRLRHEQRLATVGTFASGLAHEINNTLLPMLLYCEQALDDIEPGHPARSNVEQILVAALRANDVISKLLAFSRPPEQQQLDAFDPATVVTEALDLFSALIPPNIELKTDIRSQGKCVLGDPTALNQAVLNLITNAVYAMRGTGGILSISLTFAGTPPQVAELRVHDSGSGMTRETLDRIFEPFFTTRGVGEGTGLGLSVVHGIVTGMGGTIKATSDIGLGTEFVIVLPRLAAGEAP
jgi:signal transduction histidine kinase